MKDTKEVKELKKFQLSELESKDIEIIELKRQILQNQLLGLQGQFENIITNFCKRVNQKREDVITSPDGRIFIDNGMVTFKE
jgi:hypothetical protein